MPEVRVWWGHILDLPPGDLAVADNCSDFCLQCFVCSNELFGLSLCQITLFYQQGNTHRVLQRSAAKAVDGVGLCMRLVQQPLHYRVAALRRRQMPARVNGLSF